MKKRSANIFIFLIVLCTSFLSFSQNDDGLQILEDSDDILIKFENHFDNYHYICVCIRIGLSLGVNYPKQSSGQ